MTKPGFSFLMFILGTGVKEPL